MNISLHHYQSEAISKTTESFERGLSRQLFALHLHFEIMEGKGTLYKTVLELPYAHASWST